MRVCYLTEQREDTHVYALLPHQMMPPLKTLASHPTMILPSGPRLVMIQLAVE